MRWLSVACALFFVVAASSWSSGSTKNDGSFSVDRIKLGMSDSAVRSQLGPELGKVVLGWPTVNTNVKWLYGDGLPTTVVYLDDCRVCSVTGSVLRDSTSNDVLVSVGQSLPEARTTLVHGWVWSDEKAELVQAKNNALVSVFFSKSRVVKFIVMRTNG